MTTPKNPAPATGAEQTAARKFPDKLTPLAREVDVAGVQIRAEGSTTTLTFSASSETPVERWFGKEVLSHDKGAIRMDRISGGATPLLFNHDWEDPVGMVDSARVEDKRLVVDAHFFDTARANEVRTMVNGGLKNISVGYRLHVVEENIDTETYTARDWEPFEFSIVSIPADPSVGVGRAQGQELEVRMLRAAPHVFVPPPPASPAATQETRMSQEQVAADPNAANKITAIQAEKERRQAIIDLCKANKIDARVEAMWINDGTPLSGEKSVAAGILEVMEERGKLKPTGAAALGLSTKETQRYSLFSAIRALQSPGDPGLVAAAGFEIECSRAVAKRIGREGTRSILVPGEILMRPMAPEVMQRAMATQPGSKGGYMVNVENMGFIEILRNRSVAMRMGARTISGLVGNVTFARQTGKASVTWQGGDGASVTASDQALGQLSMAPKTAIVITDVSEQLLRQSTPSAEQFVMADLAADIAIDGVDNVAINGAGGAQPIGIKNTSGITSGQDAASATYAKILAFVSTAGGLNAIRGNPGFATTTAGAARLMQVQRFSSTDSPLWEGNMLDGELVKFNAMSSEQLGSGNIIFGSWDELVIGDWGVLELATDTGGTRFNQAQVGIRALWMVDIMLRYPQAFVVGTNLS